MFFIAPIGPFPSERQITENLPSNHSQVSFPVILPPGPKGPGFISPSLVQLPTKNASFCASGPGFGAGGAWVNTVRCPPTTRAAPVATRNADFRFIELSSCWRYAVNRAEYINIRGICNCRSVTMAEGTEDTERRGRRTRHELQLRDTEMR